MKIFVTIILFIGLSSFGGISTAADSYWFVKKLDGVKLSDASKISQIFKVVTKDDIVEAPIHWASRICRYDRSIVTYWDHIKRHVVSCAYLGDVRKSVK